MKKIFLSLIICCFSLLRVSAAIDSTLVRDIHDSIRVSLVTCSPGTEVYAVYGHTALRVEIPAQGVDMAINYGLFSFEAPNFVWRFIKGETDYVVGAVGYPMFEREYTERGSSVTLQQLNLSEEEKIRLIDLLNLNLRPENREYRYNFLYNNCSTMARDKVEEALTMDVLTSQDSVQTSYRAILHQYTEGYPWLQYGIDYLLGIEADQTISARKQMFAPEYLQSYTATTQLKGAQGFYPYVVSEEVVAPVASQDSVFSFPLTPLQAMILLLLITACLCTLEFLVESRQWWFDVFLLVVQGLMGCVVAFLFFCSDHPAVDSNLHVIYLNPLPLFFIPFIIGAAVKRRTAIVQWIQVLLLEAFVVASLLTKQYVQPAAYVFVATLLMRVLHNAVVYPWAIQRLSYSNSIRRVSRMRAVIALLVVLSLPAGLRAGNTEVPKVVVGVVVDQLRADYLEKYAHLYGDEGFKKLFAEGRVYTNGYFAHANPDRSSAVASVYSGSTPYYHGITGNRFLEQEYARVGCSGRCSL